MKFHELLNLLDDIPVFESAFLIAGNVKPDSIRLQLARWTKGGKLYQLRRGLYAIAPPYQKVKPHSFVIANLMQRASYVSLQSALAFHGLIPDTVHGTLSITAGRPECLETPLGDFEFRHVKREVLHGYRMMDLLSSKPGQQALVATPEKALLDLVYLQPGSDKPNYLTELRLQNLERLNITEIYRQAEIFKSPKLLRAADVIAHLAQNETQEYEPL
jgi:predicted transcriptional regulator of viral defense system